MNKQIVVAAAAIALGSSLMVACSSHTNPLLTENKVKAAKFIEEASQYAQVHGKFSGFQNSDNYYKCYHNITALDNPFEKTSKHRCDEFFNLMVRYGKTTKLFSSVSVSDLKNEKVLPRLDTYIQDFDDNNMSNSQMNREEKKLLKQEK